MLNVRSTERDLTAVARIRNAAIDLFGRDGFDRVSIRMVANLAGVSPALVIHHFGSKDDLRAECDRHIVSELFAHKGALVGTGATSAMQDWLNDIETFRPFINYLARMLTDASPAADALFDRLRDGTAAMLDEQIAAGLIREPIDREIIAIYLTVYGVSPLIMGRQVARSLGGTELDEAMIRRSTLPILDLYTNGLFVNRDLLEGAEDALARTAAPSSGKGEHDPNQDPDPPTGGR